LGGGSTTLDETLREPTLTPRPEEKSVGNKAMPLPRFLALKSAIHVAAIITPKIRSVQTIRSPIHLSAIKPGWPHSGYLKAFQTRILNPPPLMHPRNPMKNSPLRYPPPPTWTNC
jgi:hypothetical protein